MHNLVSSYSALSSQMISPYKCRYILYIYSPLYTTRFSHSVTYYIHIYIYIHCIQTNLYPTCIFLPVKPSSGCLKKKETRLRIPTSCSLSLSDLKKNDPPWNGFISHLWRKIIGTQLLVKGDMDSFPGKLRWNPNSRGFGGKMIFRIPSVGDFSLPAVDFRGCFYTAASVGVWLFWTVLQYSSASWCLRYVGH